MSCRILVIGHGTLPQDMVNAAEMIYGEAEGVKVICLPPDQDMDAYRAAISGEIQNSAGEGLLILADFKGGTPFLTASRLMKDFWDQEVELVTGLNLPMLTEVFNSMDGATAAELADCAIQAGAEGVTNFRQAIAARRQEEVK